MIGDDLQQKVVMAAKVERNSEWYSDMTSLQSRSAIDGHDRLLISWIAKIKKKKKGKIQISLCKSIIDQTIH